jgi:hypothetical protein
MGRMAAHSGQRSFQATSGHDVMIDEPMAVAQLLEEAAL